MGMPKDALTESRRGVIVALARNGGAIDDPKIGRATSKLVAVAQGSPATMTAAQSVLKGLAGLGFIERQQRGKRTYRIALVNDALPPKFREAITDAVPGYFDPPAPVVDHVATNGSKPAEVVEPVEVDVPAEPEPSAPATEPAPAGVDYPSLAAALLDQVGHVLASGVRPDGDERARALEADLVDARNRLALALEQSEKHRKRARQLGDELESTRRALSAERTRRQRAEAQLDEVVKQAQQATDRALSDRSRRELERFVTERPRVVAS